MDVTVLYKHNPVSHTRRHRQSDQSKLGGGGVMVWSWPLGSSERFWNRLEMAPSCSNTAVPQSRSIKTWLSEFGADEHDWPGQS